MSQNVFTTTSVAGMVRVRAGWDVPLNEFFCSVEQLQAGQLDELPSCFLQTSYESLEDMMAALQQAAIAVPPGFLEVLGQDVHVRAGNVLRDFDQKPPRSTNL